MLLKRGKICFKCGKWKLLSDYYTHPQMKDGHLNKCKDCTKNDSRTREHLHGKEIYLRYKLSTDPEVYREKQKIKQQTQRERYPEKYKARTAVSNAIRDGRLFKQPCSVCGSDKSQAHHKDYSKPLDVEWMCRKCHLADHGKTAYEL